MATKATGFPSRVDRMIVFFNSFELLFFSVLLVGSEEWFYIPAGSLPKIRRDVSCILFLLEQNRVVDLTVAEDHPDSILESNVLSVDFTQLLSRRMSDSPRQFCQKAFYSPLSIQFLTKTFCIRGRYAISLDLMSVFHAFSGQDLCNISFAL